MRPDRPRLPPDVARRLRLVGDDALAGTAGPDPSAHPAGASAPSPTSPVPGAASVARPPDAPSRTTAPPGRADPTLILGRAVLPGPAEPAPYVETPSVEAPAPWRTRVRWAPSWRVTGAAVLTLALVGGGIALRAASVPQGEPVLLPTPGPYASPAAGPPPADAADEARPAAAGEVVVVHVVGAVERPGVVELPVGARVADAVAATGGSRPDADLAAVNLARVLVDGEQLVVPVAGAAPPLPVAPVAPTARAAVDGGLLDLNAADQAALEELPGVGPVLAGRIVAHREEQPFTSVDDLDDVTGVGPALMEQLRPLVTVGG